MYSPSINLVHYISTSSQHTFSNTIVYTKGVHMREYKDSDVYNQSVSDKRDILNIKKSYKPKNLSSDLKS